MPTLFEPESWRFQRMLLFFTCLSLEAGPLYFPLTGSPLPYVRENTGNRSAAPLVRPNFGNRSAARYLCDPSSFTFRVTRHTISPLQGGSPKLGHGLPPPRRIPSVV